MGTNEQESPIYHVFVLMMENRSFDHMLGFAGVSGVDAVTGKPTRADDLVDNPRFNADPADPATQVFAASPADLKIYPPDPDRGHEFRNALIQLCGAGAVYPDPATGKYPPSTPAASSRVTG